MLRSSSYGSSGYDDLESASTEFIRLILRTSAQLADCEPINIESIVRSTLGEVGTLESADHIFWFSVSQGCHLESLISTSVSQDIAALIGAGLHKLPWCRTELEAGRAVIVSNVSELLSFAPIDHLFLSDQAIHSIALIPFSLSRYGTEVLGMLSTSAPIYWPDRLEDHCSLLGSIFLQASQRRLAADCAELMVVKGISEKRRAEREPTRSQGQVKTLVARLIQFQENERNRLSSELHDDIGQRLSLVTSEVALLVSQIHPASSDLLSRLSIIRDDLGTLCSDIHALSHTLHSYKLQHLGLKPALRELCARLSQPGFLVTLACDGSDEPKSKTISLCLYRIAQEALNNALRHARTPAVTVTLTKAHNSYYMTVQDFGVGFNANSTPLGVGLVSMKERVILVDGQIKVRSSPGRGTEIWVAIPQARDISGPVVKYRAAPAFQASSPKREVA
jgi:signal transduction histidine kinase